MAEYVLVMRQDGADLATYDINAPELIVGRSSECDVALPDSLVSRRHARFWVERGVLYVADLGSRNGILVNGRPTRNSALEENDRIVIGSHEFAVQRRSSAGILSDTSTMISFEKAGALYSRIIQEEGSGRLPILYKAAQLMGSVFDLDDLLKQILELIFEAVPAQRGYVVIVPPQPHAQPDVRASLHRSGSDEGPPISQTLIRHTLREKNAILTTNAQEDQRFTGSESVLGFAIQAAMCAPLCARELLIGAIYVDSGSESCIFSGEDLQLLTAIGRVVGVAVDNARLHQEMLLRERLSAIGEATAGIGHCVKNIMVGIKGGGELIDMGLEQQDWKWVQKGWPLVRRSALRIENLVMNLLSFSGQHELRLEASQIEHLVAEVFDMSMARAEQHGVELKLERGEVGIVYLDSRDIFRVILNLVGNAIDACEDNGGVVIVTTRKDAHGAYIDVADNGPGIPPEIQAKLFHAFMTTKGSKGTGLGLACSDRIVRAHGGEIWLESAEGKGAKFTVFLPTKTLAGPSAENRRTLPAMGPRIPSD